MSIRNPVATTREVEKVKGAEESGEGCRPPLGLGLTPDDLIVLHIALITLARIVDGIACPEVQKTARGEKPGPPGLRMPWRTYASQARAETLR